MKSRRRRPEEFGLLTKGGGLYDDSSDDYDSEPVSLERYRGMRIAAGLTRGGGGEEEEDGDSPAPHGHGMLSDYAQAASELSHVLTSCLKVAEKPAVAAIYSDALLAARYVAGLETSAQLAAAARLQRAARLALPQVGPLYQLNPVCPTARKAPGSFNPLGPMM
jgi:hypothetical protein